ncbi:MAG TPA: SOS response-associated peptidase family protein [Sphingopyxis sp.]|uniref:SOS response-associated peptidase n=1 Tax=Sphingopyxis sp. TaxID=1908224 RepID=UPI002E0F7C71|nr:SOS response-associated peptidase family protein [Sphingopyxis sp.]
MCNLYTNKSTVQEMAALFRTSATYGFNAPTDVYPQYPGIVVREDQGQRILQQMTWGFPRHSVNKRTGKPNKPTATNNARDDKLWTIWRQWFTNPARRCLIPFTSFAEAEGKPGQMTRTWISVEDQPIAAWAALWRPTVEWGDAYTGVMVDATEELFHIHDRMPVILHPEAHEAWLRADAQEAMALVTQYPANQLAVERTSEPWFARKVQVSDGPTLI